MPRRTCVIILLVIFICFLLIDVSYAASDHTRTFVPIGQTPDGGKVGLQIRNGRFWNGLNSNEKAIYILGMLGGVDSFFIASEPAGTKYIEQFVEIQKSFHPSNFNNGEIANMIDGFYEDTSNIKVPIFEQDFKR